MSNIKTISLLSFFRTSPLEAVNFLIRLEHTLKEITMNQAELKAALESVEVNQEATQATLTKVVTEVQTLITALANTSNTLDPAVEEIVNKLIATAGTNSELATKLDGMNADAAPIDMVSAEGSSPS